MDKTVEIIAEIGTEARQAFVDRDELITMLELAMVCGEHAIVLGAPGTGKSQAVRFFAAKMGLPFFRRVLNPDLPREDLVGPIDPIALQKGQWDRCWLGVATNPIVFLDEIGKASPQVMNTLLDAMEERVVTCGSTERAIPLHTLISASNETISNESPAIWDRFTLRTVVRPIGRSSDFDRLLKDAWAASDLATGPNGRIGVTDLDALRGKCREMASVATENNAANRAMVRLWSDFGNVSEVQPSDRRWLRVLVVAAANALLSGRDAVATADLTVARFIVWDDPDEIAAITAFVAEIVEQDSREFKTAAKVLEQMQEAFNGLDATNLEQSATLSFRAKALQREIVTAYEENGKDSSWGDLLVSTRLLIGEIEELVLGAVDPIL